MLFIRSHVSEGAVWKNYFVHGLEKNFCFRFDCDVEPFGQVFVFVVSSIEHPLPPQFFQDSGYSVRHSHSSTSRWVERVAE